MKIIEKWGTGIPRLFEACEEYGLPKPELIDFDGDFRVNLYRKKETDTEINEKIYQRVNDVIGRVYQRKNEPQNEPQRLGVLEEGLLNLIRQDGHVTRDEMASQMKVSLSTVKRSINKLKDNGLIEYEGSSKSGYWIIKQS